MNTQALLQIATNVVIYGVLFGIGREILKLYGRKAYGGVDQIMANNSAVALRNAAFYGGLGISLAAMLVEPSQYTTIYGAIAEASLWGVGTLAMLVIALFVNDTFILWKCRNNEQLAAGNVSVGLVEAACLLGSGMIIAASLMGEGSVLSTIVFFLIGQVLMVVTAGFFELITRRLYVTKEIAEGNVSAGIYLGFKIFAGSLIVANAIRGDFTGWVPDIQATLIYYAIGVALLWAAEWLIDLLYLPNIEVEDIVEQKKIAPVLMVGGATVATALIVTAVSVAL